MRRVIAKLLVVLLLIGLIPDTVMAADKIDPGVKQKAISNVETKEEDLELIENGKFPTVYFPTAGYYNEENTWKTALKSRLCSAIENLYTQVDLTDVYRSYGDTAMDGMSECFEEVKNENPSFFYVETYSYYYSSSSGWIVTLYYRSDYCTDSTSNIPDNTKIETAKTKYQAGLNRALSCVDDSMSNVEKVLAVHDWIVRECDYDYENYLSGKVPNSSYSDTGVFIDGKAVCNGYALAFSVIMQQLGIPSYFVGSNRMNHAWNLVYVNGAWYHVDTTYDDPVWNGSTAWGYRNNDYVDEGYVNHEFFLLSDTEMSNADHFGWDSSLPSASVSGSFTGYCFYQNRSDMTYVDGYWYYADGRSIVKSTINGAMTVARTLPGQIMYMHSNDKTLYYLLAGTQNLVYSIPIDKLADDDYAPIMDQNVKSISDAGYTVSEFGIKDNSIIVVSEKAGTFKRDTFEFEYLNLNGICYILNDNDISVGVSYDTNSSNIQFQWLSYNLDTGKWEQITEWYGGNWMSWKPENGNYWLQARAKTQTGDMQTYTICFKTDKNYKENSLKLEGFCYIDQGDRFDIGTAYESDENVEFRWLAYDLNTGNWSLISDWYAGNWTSWKPRKGNYWIQVQARTASGIEKSDTLCFYSDKDYGVTLSLDGICYFLRDTGIDVGVAYNSADSNVQFQWMAYNLDTKCWQQITDWYGGNWMRWNPVAGNYWLQVQAKNSDGTTETYTTCFQVDKNY